MKTTIRTATLKDLKSGVVLKCKSEGNTYSIREECTDGVWETREGGTVFDSEIACYNIEVPVEALTAEARTRIQRHATNAIKAHADVLILISGEVKEKDLTAYVDRMITEAAELGHDVSNEINAAFDDAVLDL